jgi:hypothetical protein
MSTTKLTSGARTERVIAWLLDGDPAIRWPLQDLVGAAEASVEHERRKVTRDGWGARLLVRQDPQGTWAGGLYSLKWTSTTYTMRCSATSACCPAAGRREEPVSSFSREDFSATVASTTAPGQNGQVGARRAEGEAHRSALPGWQGRWASLPARLTRTLPAHGQFLLIDSRPCSALPSGPASRPVLFRPRTSQSVHT